MADALATLLEDPERALLMTERARGAVARYSWPQVRRAWAEAYAT
jgi:glycosyltransferase involved in cell wall biosynthesis